MAEVGFVLLWRKFFAHRYWKDKREYSRAEAWLDCWGCMAGFEPYEILVSGRKIRLGRGEFMASDRFLEKRWGWSRGKVRRFIEAAVESGELEVAKTGENDDTSNGTNVGTTYRIVKYEDYQLGGTSDDTSDGAKANKRKKEKTSAVRETWLTPFADAWQASAKGKPNYGQMASVLGLAIDEHGSELVLRAWLHYLKVTDTKYLSLARFGEKVGYWIEESRPTFLGYTA